MRKKLSATCPISYRCSAEESINQRSKLLNYIFSGYQTCTAVELYDNTTQTDLQMSDLDDCQEIIEIYTGEIEKTPEEERFNDVIESEDEYLSVGDGKTEETYPDMPHSINIQLKDTPCILMEDGLHKTKISLTPEYLEQNGLELVIGEGPNRIVKLKSGNNGIYPPQNLLPTDVVISVTDGEESNPNKDGSTEITKTEKRVDHESTDVDFKTSKLRLGMLSLTVDKLNEQYIDDLLKERNTLYPGGIIKFFDDYELPIDPNKPNNDEGGKVYKAIAEEGKEKEEVISKSALREEYNRVKKNFFWTALEGDPTIDAIKEGVIDELAKHDYKMPVKEQFSAAIGVQTDVHINPNIISDCTYTEETDSLLRRYYELRGKDHDTPMYKQQLPDPSENLFHDKTLVKTFTNEATVGQMGSDISIKTEPTMEGIPELTEKNEVVEEIPNLINKFDNEEQESSSVNDTDEEIFEIYEKKVESFTSIVQRSKGTDTDDLVNESKKNNKDVFDVMVSTEINAGQSSLLRTLQNFEDELSPLQSELSRLHLEFKSIDISDELNHSFSDPPLSTKVPALPDVHPYTDVNPFVEPYADQPPGPSSAYGHSSAYGRPTYEPFYDYYRYRFSHLTTPQRPSIREQPCTCPPGTCLGFRRSSGIECQRLRRLPPHATSGEFLREFTRPAWMENNVFRPDSIVSEPEDILGDTPSRPTTSRNINKDKYNDRNKPDKF